jgi:hypothetical protein
MRSRPVGKEVSRQDRSRQLYPGEIDKAAAAILQAGMDKQNRRDAIRDYKERKVSQGIFAVRCAVTGEAWVGRSRNLEQQPNSIWFSLRMGGHRNPALQAAYSAHGAAAFAFEVLETIEDEGLSAYGRDNLLKDRDVHWRAALGATKIVG